MSVDVQPTEIWDSLPYYDDDLQKYPELKQKVEEEMARDRKPNATLHPRVPPPFKPLAVRERVFSSSVVHLVTLCT